MNTTTAKLSVVVLCVASITLMYPLTSRAEYNLADASGVWLLDEGEGDVAKDTSAKGNDGALWRGPLWVDGRFGKALQFDGKSFVWMKDTVGMPELTSPRTLMCYFKWAEINDWANILMDVTDGECLLSVGSNNWRQRVTIGIYSEGGPGVDTFDDREEFNWPGDAEWHHLAAVFPEGETKTSAFIHYFDGVLQEDTFLADNDNAITSNGVMATIGNMSGSMTNFFRGIVDEAAVFPIALTADDIKRAARSGLVGGQLEPVSPQGKLATAWGSLKTKE